MGLDRLCTILIQLIEPLSLKTMTIGHHVMNTDDLKVPLFSDKIVLQPIFIHMKLEKSSPSCKQQRFVIFT